MVLVAVVKGVHVVNQEHVAFALAVHRAMAPDRARNACWSPWSVAVALCVLAELAVGQTRKQLVAALLGDPAADLRPATRLLTLAAEMDETFDRSTVVLATTLWVEEQLQIRQDPAVSAPLGGDVRAVAFRADSEAARAVINEAVAQSTSGLIPELIPPGALGPDTVAALVTALYLRTSWHSPFPEELTTLLPFHAPGGARDVPTMEQELETGYAASHGWQLVEIPGQSGVDAVVLLPDEDLPAAEPGLDAETLIEVLAAARYRQGQLFLPRVTITDGCDLTGSLRKLGVTSLFGPDADLGRIHPGPVSVTSVWHEAVLNVAEAGMEGAAATAGIMATGLDDAVPEEPVVVRVDRPFLFLVRHRRSGVFCFMARVTEP